MLKYKSETADIHIEIISMISRQYPERKLRQMEPDIFSNINPYVRMMRLKKTSGMSGKWRDFDNLFTYIAGGSSDFIVDGVRYSLKTGNIILIPPCKTHLIVPHGDNTLVQYIMHFDFFSSPDRIALENRDVLNDTDISVPDKEQLLDQKVLISRISESEHNDIARRYLSMYDEFQDSRPGRDILLSSDCKALLIKTLRHMHGRTDSRNTSDSRKTKSWVHIENAVEYIHNCPIDGPLDNDSVAKATGVSPNYLTRVFQEFMGMPLHKYIVNIKLEKAQQLLLSGKTNITDVAEKAGFSSIHVFSRRFKNEFGISPSEFMDQVVSREYLRAKVEDKIIR